MLVHCLLRRPPVGVDIAGAEAPRERSKLADSSVPRQVPFVIPAVALIAFHHTAATPRRGPSTLASAPKAPRRLGRRMPVPSRVGRLLACQRSTDSIALTAGWSPGLASSRELPSSNQTRARTRL